MTTTITLTHIGGPTIRVAVNGFCFLTDPTFDAAGGAYPIFPQRTLDKLADPAIGATDVGPLDAVLLSHDEHADNLDARGRALLTTVPVVLTTESGAGRVGGVARGLAPWESMTFGDDERSIRVTAVPARHGPPGSEPIVGDVIGFVLDGPGLARAVYITGDTVWYDALPPIAGRFDIGLVIAHLGNVQSPDGAALTMSSADVPALAATFPDAMLVPVHFEGWKHFSETEQVLRATPAAERLRFLTRGRAETIELPLRRGALS